MWQYLQEEQAQDSNPQAATQMLDLDPEMATTLPPVKGMHPLVIIPTLENMTAVMVHQPALSTGRGAGMIALTGEYKLSLM